MAAAGCCIAPFAGSAVIGTPRAWLQGAFRLANDALTDFCRREGRLSFATLTAAVLERDRVTLAAVGDTPAYLLRGASAAPVLSPRRRWAGAVEGAS